MIVEATSGKVLRTLQYDEIDNVDVVLGSFLPTNANDLRITFFGPERKLLHAGRRTNKLRVNLVEIQCPQTRNGKRVIMPRMTKRDQDPKSKLGGGIRWPEKTALFVARQLQHEFVGSSVDREEEEKA